MWKFSAHTDYYILPILDVSFKVLTQSQCTKYRCSIQHSRCYSIFVRQAENMRTNESSLMGKRKSFL